MRRSYNSLFSHPSEMASLAWNEPQATICRPTCRPCASPPVATDRGIDRETHDEEIVRWNVGDRNVMLTADDTEWCTGTDGVATYVNLNQVHAEFCIHGFDLYEWQLLSHSTEVFPSLVALKLVITATHNAVNDIMATFHFHCLFTHKQIYHHIHLCLLSMTFYNLSLHLTIGNFTHNCV